MNRTGIRCALVLLGFFATNPIGHAQDGPAAADAGLFARKNLVAWCIVPFDGKHRGPEERAEMLARLGFQRFAYDWRAEHLPTFDTELAALKRRGIRLEAVWFPAQLNREARAILEVLQRHKIKTQLWVTMSDPAPQADAAGKVAAAARLLRPLAEEAATIGCSITLYNHGGWFGQPENLLAIIKALKLSNIGMVYNLHHGHEHLDRFPDLLTKMLPHLWAVNLNGMIKDGDRLGKKILPLGQGDRDLELLRAIQASGYRGPLGILGHTQDDAEERLRDNLDGLDWLTTQLANKPAGPRPKPRTYRDASPTPGGKPQAAATQEYSAKLVDNLLAEAKATGNAAQGALVFRSAQFACLSCHKVGSTGGLVGPDLTSVGKCLPPEHIVEGLLWPKRQVKEEFKALSVFTTAGKQFQGYKERETDRELVLRDPATGKSVAVAKQDIEARTEVGTLMPDGLAQAMTPKQLRDLLRFLFELGHTPGLVELAAHTHAAATFPHNRAPLHPEHWPNWQQPVNSDRVYDFYARQADHFREQATVPPLLAEYPGLDGPRFGHWGKQSEPTWADDRWNNTILGSLMSGVFHGAGVTVPKGVCVRLGEKGELSACFNPETLQYEAVWQGGFVKFSSVRHGFLHGLLLDGTALPRPAGAKPERPFTYHGFYRHGRRVLFSYTLDGVLMLDAPWAEGGQFTRVVAPAHKHPLRHLTQPGPAQWPQILTTRGTRGTNSPYAVDTIQPPFDNPWKAPLFFGDHDFLPDGSALLSTMQGDVWHVSGLDAQLDQVRWRRFAAGLHQALGLVVSGGEIFVLGRDQITRLHDRDGDGEADFYECFSNVHQTSPGGHDYLCGLHRDAACNFFTASSKQGLLRISADGKQVEVHATGFRNPDGVGLYPDGAVTVPCSEGEWTPASMICLVKPPAEKGQPTAPPYFGYGGPKDGKPPALPLVYLPRGVDNSSGGQIYIDGDRWGPLQGRMVHFSYGAGAHFLLLRDESGRPQGAVVPLPGEFLSGAHRGRFHPRDGQLYVSGMGGWGNYGLEDGCFHRVRYTGEPVQLPTAFQVYQNGVRVTFAQPLDRVAAERPRSHFAQAWNYRYSIAYGSPEFSARHPGTPGHDPLTVASAHVLADGRSLFLELPDLQPVNQLHLRLRVGGAAAHDLFLTVHGLGEPFTELPGYRPRPKTVAAHPILADLAAAKQAAANPWRKAIPKAVLLSIQADKNLTFVQRSLTVRAGQPVRLIFSNPDSVPHNWVLLKPGTLERVGDLANRLIANPEAAVNQYIPTTPDVLVYTDVVPPQGSFTIFFHAPQEKGRYPYLCTFPGHWMVMNGVLHVE